MKKTIYVLSMLCMAVACTEKAGNPDLLDQAEEFTFKAVAGVETKISSSYDSDANMINFTWSEGDSLHVIVVETDSLATMTEEKANALPTYIFKLKSGAGTATGVFSSKEFVPSNVMKAGVSYSLRAAYRPYVHEDGLIWHYDEGLGGILPDIHVDINQTYYASNPVRNVAEQEMLVSRYGVFTLDDEPSVQFNNMLAVIKLKVKNIDTEDISISSLEYPACDQVILADFNDGCCFYYGMDRGTLLCDSPVTIPAGQQHLFFLAYSECAFAEGRHDDTSYTISMTDGSKIKVSNGAPNDMVCKGRMYTTTLKIKSSSTASGEIPGIGGEEEEF